MSVDVCVKGPARVLYLVDVRPAVTAHVTLLDDVAGDGGATIVQRRFPLQQHRVAAHLLMLQRLRLGRRACEGRVVQSLNKTKSIGEL